MPKAYTPPAGGTTTLRVPRGIKPPRVYMPYEVWARMFAYIQAAQPHEINGFGITELIETTDGPFYWVSEVMILEQVVTTGHAEMVDSAVHAFMAEMIGRGIDPGTINFQWHSHVNMGVTFSGIDTATMDRWTGTTLISTVLNLRGEHNTRIDVYEPFRLAYETELIIGDPPVPQGISDSIVAEVAAKVSVRKPVYKKAAAPTKATARRGPMAAVKAAVGLGGDDQATAAAPADDGKWSRPDDNAAAKQPVDDGKQQLKLR